MKKLLHKYLSAVRKNCLPTGAVSVHSVAYWQNQLFTSTMQVMLPLSLIALVPGVIYSIIANQPFIAVMDLASFALILYIALGKGLAPETRKILLILCIYVLAVYLLIYIGFKGPGFLFLYAACIFGILILPVQYAYTWSWINVAICGLFTGVIHFDLSPLQEVNDMSAGEWIAISVNLVFLSFLTSALLPVLLKGLSQSFEQQKMLQEELKAKQASLEQVLKDLEQKNQDLEQFAYVASHDLQEPLRMINNFLSQIEKKYAQVLDEKGKQYIHFAVDGGKRMRTMINDLLEFSRAGRHQNALESIPLDPLVTEVIQVEQHSIETTRAKIHYSRLPVVSSLRTPLLQVFQNLISNALKYCKKEVRPEIYIEARELEKEWQILVSDNGIGIEKSCFDKIFVIFQRLHTSSDYSGTGIGLAIVKKNIENLGGRIWVESEVGKGSTFYFTIPK